jgi:hypothetical protein
MFGNTNWEDDFDDLAGLLGAHRDSDSQTGDETLSIDQALKDLFGE